MKHIALFLILASLILVTFAKKLEKVSDDEFLKLVKNEKFVVALFSKNTPKCQDYEHELAMAREELVDSIGAWAVKLVSSPLVRLYSPDLEPAIVFFRHGIPMLYNGPINEEDIVNKIQKSQDPAVKELSDINFEHLTQASTGATTGDWLIMFYKDSCVTSQRLNAVLEAVGIELKNRVNVARVSRDTAGVTSRRFSVSGSPAFVLFRHGKLYRYELEEINIQTLVDFATDFYRNSKAEAVPAPKSPFDDFTEMIAELLKENPQYLTYGSVAAIVFLVLAVALKLREKPPKPQKSKKKK